MRPEASAANSAGSYPPIEQVPGVEAPLDGRTVEHRADIIARLDERAGVRVQRVASARARRTARRARRACRRGGATRRATVGSGPTTQRRRRRSTRTLRSRSPPNRSACGRAGVERGGPCVAVVEDEWHEPADQLEPVAIEHGRGARWRRSGRKPGRPELDRGDAERRHLGRARGRPAASTPHPGTSQTPHEIGPAAIRRRARCALQHVLTWRDSVWSAPQSSFHTSAVGPLSRIRAEFVGALYCPCRSAVLHWPEEK